MTADATRVVTVEIMGQRYPIRSSLDPEYIARLAQYVDDKIQSAAAQSPSDSVRLAVLAALNIADEYFRLQNGSADTSGQLRLRTGEIEKLVDRALESFG